MGVKIITAKKLADALCIEYSNLSKYLKKNDFNKYSFIARSKHNKRYAIKAFLEKDAQKIYDKRKNDGFYVEPMEFSKDLIFNPEEMNKKIDWTKKKVITDFSSMCSYVNHKWKRPYKFSVKKILKNMHKLFPRFFY